MNDTSAISELCHKAEEPIFITKNGYGDMVLMSMELFEATQKKWSMYSDSVTQPPGCQGRQTDRYKDF